MNIIIGFLLQILTLLALHESFYKCSFSDSEYQNPIILIPGYGGSRLDAYSDTRFGPNLIKVWVNYFFITFPKFLTRITKLSYDPKSHTTSDSNGFTIRVPGWGDTRAIEQLDDITHSRTTYFAPLVEHILQSPFYKRDFTLRGAPYDFRKAPNEMELFYWNLKELVEETYYNAGNRKVVILGHSLGCLHSLYFLKQMPFEWKKHYLKAFISVSGPYGGSVEDLLLETNGKSFGGNIDPMRYRELERSFPSSSFLLPNEMYFGNTTLVRTTQRNYSAQQYDELFTDMGYENGFLMYKDVRNLIKPSENIEESEEHYCIHGSGINTTSSIFLENLDNSKPKKTYGLGDGMVNSISLEICKVWKNVNYRIIEGANHDNILHNPLFLDMLDSILSGK